MDPTLKTKILQRLKSDIGTLSPALKNVAKYIVDNSADFGLDPIRETARKSGVSTYTLVRLADQFGFASYDELREPFRVALVSRTESIKQQPWIDELREQGATGVIQAEVALKSIAVVQDTLKRQTPQKLERVVDTLLAADTVYLTAMRASYAMAYYFQGADPDNPKKGLSWAICERADSATISRTV